MNPERWERVKDVFHGALELDSPGRAAYLATRCDGDEELRREVQSLLDAADGPDSLPGASSVSLRAAEQLVLEQALGRHYEILKLLGQGGMGAVYLARDRMLDRFVAIKVLRPELAEAADVRERFRREARVAAQLNHPGILPLHAFGEVQGLWYFVMAYVRGATLADRLRREGALPPDDAQRILLQLADALECAHRRGVIHRDIKPANVLLDEETGNAILADFGISKLRDSADRLTKSGAIVGTPHFMSPEQALGSSQVDERSDIYSLGAVGYAMLAGHEPFSDTPPEEILYLRATQDPVPLQQVAPQVPGELADLVMRCLHRDRDMRWQRARDLRDALARLGGDASALPETLRDIPTFGPYAVAWIVVWTLLALQVERTPGERALLLLVAVLIPGGLALHLWNAGRHGLSIREIARAACWPPEWWGMWWPLALRRPNDLWPRLPRFARWTRGIASGALVAVPLLILGRSPIAAMVGSADMTWFFIGEGTLAAIGIAAVIAGLAWGRAQGLDFGEASRLVLGATVDGPGWREPALERLLDSAPGRLRKPRRDSPAEYRRAIAEIVARLSPEFRPLGESALTAATRLMERIEACDAELGALNRIGGARELEQLEWQVAELDAGRTQEQREMRELLTRQLDLVRRSSAKAEAVQRERAQYCDLLRGLWTQLARLHAPSGMGTVARDARASVERLVAEGQAAAPTR